MKTITNIAKMQEFGRQLRIGGLRAGFVPTMGSLHEGHLELIRAARATCDVVIVSIFVNPTQFNCKEDFDRYPRNEERDRHLLESERVDVLFTPPADDVYPKGAATTIRVAGLTDTLCGPRRPGHFEGVATVVAALLNMVRPDVAFFGEKDYQQLQVIRRMVTDLHFPVRVEGVPSVRESNGLAMSSRNARLDPDQRRAAVVLSRGLHAAAAAFAAGENGPARLLAVAREHMSARPEIRLEYLEVVDARTLQPVEQAATGSVMAVAAWLGDVRLIDNVILGRALVGDGREDVTDGRSVTNGPETDDSSRGRSGSGVGPRGSTPTDSPTETFDRLRAGRTVRGRE